MLHPDAVQRISSDALFAARLAFLRWKSDYLFERSKESYLRWRLNAKFGPNQPRVPAGHGRESGRWIDDAITNLSDLSSTDSRMLARNIIWICTREDFGQFPDGTWVATYRCSGGQLVRREGAGRSRGFIPDPFRR